MAVSNGQNRRDPAMELSELRRARKLMDEVKERLDLIRTVGIGAENITDLIHLTVGWDWFCDSRTRTLEALLEQKIES